MTIINTQDAKHLRSWIGNSETQEEQITAFPANGLAAMLDYDCGPYESGNTLPPLWHWLHFLKVYARKDTGEDGHQKLGGFFPPVPLPRRMWAGSRFRFFTPLIIGRTLRKTSTIKDVVHKKGRSGELMFVTIRHQIFDQDTLCCQEDQDIVYRTVSTNKPPPIAPREGATDSTFSQTVHPDPVLLFKYSALTFNGHRIHYDRPYAADIEGYDGLVVHGPLLATLLLDMLRKKMPEVQISSFEFRALAAVIDTNDFTLHGQPTSDGSSVKLWICRHDGALAMSANATIFRNSL